MIIPFCLLGNHASCKIYTVLTKRLRQPSFNFFHIIQKGEPDRNLFKRCRLDLKSMDLSFACADEGFSHGRMNYKDTEP
jgi:hypothetical protein